MSGAFDMADVRPAALLPTQLLLSPRAPPTPADNISPADAAAAASAVGVSDAPVSPITPSSTPSSPDAGTMTLGHHAPVPVYPAMIQSGFPLGQPIAFGDFSRVPASMSRPQLPTPVSDPGSPSLSAQTRSGPQGKRRMQPPPGTICRYFLQGRCWAGEQCRWSHVVPLQPVFSPFPGQQAYIFPAFGLQPTPTAGMSPPAAMSAGPPSALHMVRPTEVPLSPLSPLSPVSSLSGFPPLQSFPLGSPMPNIHLPSPHMPLPVQPVPHPSPPGPGHTVQPIHPVHTVPTLPALHAVHAVHPMAHLPPAAFPPGAMGMGVHTVALQVQHGQHQLQLQGQGQGPQQQCFFWRQGRCKFGANCRYAHY